MRGRRTARRDRRAAELARLFVALDAAAGAGGGRPPALVAQSHERVRSGAATLRFRSAG